jgi:carboxylate-amine ligase
MMLEENRFRAARFGTEGKLIDFSKQTEVSYTELFEELLDFVSEESERLGTMHELQRLRDVLKNGTGAQRQRKVYEETKSFEKVVEYIIRETHHGLGVEPPLEPEVTA